MQNPSLYIEDGRTLLLLVHGDVEGVVVVEVGVGLHGGQPVLGRTHLGASLHPPLRYLAMETKITKIIPEEKVICRLPRMIPYNM